MTFARCGWNLITCGCFAVERSETVGSFLPAVHARPSSQTQGPAVGLSNIREKHDVLAGALG